MVLIAQVSDQVPLGTTLSNALAIASATPEVELLDNESQARVWIGWWLSLPAILRAR